MRSDSRLSWPVIVLGSVATLLGCGGDVGDDATAAGTGSGAVAGAGAGAGAKGGGNGVGGAGAGGGTGATTGSGGTAGGGNGGRAASGGASTDGAGTGGSSSGAAGRATGAGAGGDVAAGGGGGMPLGGMAGSAAGDGSGGQPTGGRGGATPMGGQGGASAGKGGSAGASNGVCSSPVASLALRPQLSSTDAAKYTIATYLASSGSFTAPTVDNWVPTAGLGDASTFTADYTVAADGSGTHTTLQAALSAVSGSTRRYVRMMPGTYRGQVAYSGSTPVTLYSTSTDPTQVTIVNDKSQQDGTSETLGIKSNGFQIMNLTLSNDFPTPASGSNLQALALKTQGDKIQLENVRMHGFQDTVQFAAANATTRSRVYVKGGFIEGDTDYIYGSATVVFDGVTVHYLSSRRGTSAGVIMAPSTSVGNELGFLFIHCAFTADDATPNDKIHLGRSWDSSGTTPTPNGQGVIRESVLGGHVDRDSPWTSAATSGREYSPEGNRFYEYCNSGDGAAP